MKIISTLILLTIFFTSCALLAKPLLPLKSRTLWIDPDKAVFFSTYKKCSGRFFKKCRIVRIEYDFNDEKMRNKLRDIGFKLKVTR